MNRRKRPHMELFLRALGEDVFLEGWCSVKTATPAVTSATTRYLYSG